MSYKSQYTGEQIDEGIEKASKALTTPDTAPESISLVAVDTNNAQTNLTLGDGLSVEGGVLKASGGGGSGGSDLYRHLIVILASEPSGAGDISLSCEMGFVLYSHSNEELTIADLRQLYKGSDSPYFEKVPIFPTPQINHFNMSIADVYHAVAPYNVQFIFEMDDVWDKWGLSVDFIDITNTPELSSRALEGNELYDYVSKV